MSPWQTPHCASISATHNAKLLAYPLTPSLLLALCAGALCSPLSPWDKLPRGVSLLSPITLVFCAAEDGAGFASRFRQDVELVHEELVSVLRNVLRQVRSAWVGEL